MMPPLEFNIPQIPQNMPFPLLAAASMALPAMQSVLNYAGQKKANQQAADMAKYNTDQTIAANRQAANLAYQRDVAMWNRANEYNDPRNQMGRLKAAGLSPFMAYGSGNVVGNTSTATPTMGTPQQNYDYKAPSFTPLDLSGAGGMIAQYQDFKLGQAQIDNVKAQTKATETKTALDLVETGIRQIERDYLGREKAAGLTKSEAEARYADRNQLLDLISKGIQNAASAQEYNQRKELFPSQLEFQKGTVNEQIQRILESKKRIQGYDYDFAQKKSQTALSDDALKTQQLMRELTDQDLMTKKYQNWLRKNGTHEGDTPWSKATRDSSRFIEFLTSFLTGKTD